MVTTVSVTTFLVTDMMENFAQVKVCWLVTIKSCSQKDVQVYWFLKNVGQRLADQHFFGIKMRDKN